MLSKEKSVNSKDSDKQGEENFLTIITDESEFEEIQKFIDIIYDQLI